MCSWEDKTWSTHFRTVGDKEVRWQSQLCALEEPDGRSADGTGGRTRATLTLAPWSKPASSEGDRQLSFTLYSAVGGCYSEVREPLTTAASADPDQPDGLYWHSLAVCASFGLADSFLFPPSPHFPSIGASKAGQCCPIWFLLRLWGKEPLSLLHNKCRYLILVIGGEVLGEGSIYALVLTGTEPGSWLQLEALRPQGILFWFGGRRLKVKRTYPWIYISLCLLASFQCQ